jgi:hypothetical protein
VNQSQTLKRWLATQHPKPAGLARLQALLDAGPHGVKIPVFMVVTCTADPSDTYGRVDFVVPAADAPLVESFFSGRLSQ